MKSSTVSRKRAARISFSRGISEKNSAEDGVKVHAEFDGQPYDGSVVNMGVKYEDGSICYIIGITKAIRAKINQRGRRSCPCDYKRKRIVFNYYCIDTGLLRMIQ